MAPQSEIVPIKTLRLYIVESVATTLLHLLIHVLARHHEAYDDLLCLKLVLHVGMVVDSVQYFDPEAHFKTVQSF